MDAALEGIDVMYLACAAGPCQAGLESLAIDAARRNGTRRVVKLSAFDAHDANPSDFYPSPGTAKASQAAGGRSPESAQPSGRLRVPSAIRQGFVALQRGGANP